jgi:multidrug efflux pump subunit AcrB
LRTGVDNLGLPYSGINLAYSTSGPVGPGYADIFVNLKEGHKPTAGYVRALRKRLSADFPSTTFSFLPADMITQILNFGLPSPIDVQTVGFNVPANRAFANALLQRLHSVPGVVDLHIHQTGDYPQFNVDVDRTKAQLVGLTEQAVASNMLVSLSGSFQTSPSFWVDPKSGTQYQVATQTRSSAWKA